VAFTIGNLSKPKPFARKILVHAGSGAGKTFFAGTANDVEEMRGVHVVNLDAGAATLDGQDIATSDARKLSDLEEILWAYAQKKLEVASFRTLVLDGLSEVAKRELSEITALEAQSDKGKARSRDRDQAELRDYGVRNSRLLRIVRMARDLPDITVIFTCWSKSLYPKVPGTDQDNKAAKPLSVIPDFSDSLTDTLMGACDDVFSIVNDSANNRRLLITGDYEGIRAKTRGEAFAKALSFEKDGRVYPILVEPNFKKIVAAYHSATKKGK
jgi:hypothetical protein